MIHFLEYVVDAVTTSSLYVLLALPVALVYGIMNLVNFAQGELITVGAYALFLLGAIWLPLGIFLALLVVVAAALAMERSAFRPVRGASPETLLVTSFAVSFFLQNLALTLFGSRPKGVTTPAVLAAGVHFGAVRVQWLSILTFVLCVLCVGGLTLFLTRTSFGVQMRAAAEDFTMARLLGVRADVIVSVAFAMSGALAGVACFVLVAQGGSAYATMGLTPVLIAFVATMMGGLGSLPGAVLGAAILGTLTIVLEAVLPTPLRPARDAFVYGTVLVLLLARPNGLMSWHRERV
jgi:branched-chain amino acid transport system permease protein